MPLNSMTATFSHWRAPTAPWSKSAQILKTSPVAFTTCSLLSGNRPSECPCTRGILALSTSTRTAALSASDAPPHLSPRGFSKTHLVMAPQSECGPSLCLRLDPLAPPAQRRTRHPV